MDHVIWSAFAIVLFAVWFVAEFRSCARTRIALGLACVGIVATAWIRAELRITRLDAMRDEYGRWIEFYTEYGDPEKVQRAAAVLRQCDPGQFEEFDYWAEEDKIVAQIRKLGGWATPCDRLEPRACVYVDFRKAKVTEANLERLGKLPRIGSLHLNGTPLTDRGLGLLANLTQLQHLGLANTQITDAGLTHLKRMTQLEWLDLDGTSVADAGLEQIRGLPRLESLVLTHTRVTAEGVRRFQEARPKCEIER